jgi:hypothetical protein
MPLRAGEPARIEGDEWGRPRSCSSDHGRRCPGLCQCMAVVMRFSVDAEGAVVVLDTGYMYRAHYRDLVAALVGGEVVHYMRGWRETPVCRHRHTRQVGESRGGKQPQRWPHMPPCPARGWLIIQNEGVDTGPQQVEGGCQACLASADDHRLVMVLLGVCPRWGRLRAGFAVHAVFVVSLSPTRFPHVRWGLSQSAARCATR